MQTLTVIADALVPLGARRVGMHPATYAVHEQGRAAVKPAELQRYAEAFGVSHGWLSAGIGTGPKKVG